MAHNYIARGYHRNQKWWSRRRLDSLRETDPFGCLWSSGCRNSRHLWAGALCQQKNQMFLTYAWRRTRCLWPVPGEDPDVSDLCLEKNQMFLTYVRRRPRCFWPMSGEDPDVSDLCQEKTQMFLTYARRRPRCFWPMPGEDPDVSNLCQEKKQMFLTYARRRTRSSYRGSLIPLNILPGCCQVVRPGWAGGSCPISACPKGNLSPFFSCVPLDLKAWGVCLIIFQSLLRKIWNLFFFYTVPFFIYFKLQDLGLPCGLQVLDLKDTLDRLLEKPSYRK